MNSRTLQKIRGNPQFFSEMKPAPVSSENMAPLPLQIFTVRHSKHEKQRTFSENRKTLETSESAPQTSEMPSEASETHRKGIGKTSERHRKGNCDPSKCICFDVPQGPGHRKGIGKASKNIWKHWKASGNIGKHRKGKHRNPLEEPEQGWKLPLSFGLVDLQYKAAALETFGDCSFLYFNSLLVCSAVKVDRMLVTN